MTVELHNVDEVQLVLDGSIAYFSIRMLKMKARWTGTQMAINWAINSETALEQTSKESSKKIKRIERTLHLYLTLITTLSDSFSLATRRWGITTVREPVGLSTCGWARRQEKRLHAGNDKT